jgi:O-acetyl-ADP-ribose deacetylase (regulator of RNase III)
VITPAGELPARFVIHTVGPIWGQDPHPEVLLASCYQRSVGLADEHGLRELAFPAISTGAYGYPKPGAAAIASQALIAALGRAKSVERVHLVFFAAADAGLFAHHQRFEVTEGFSGG